jgi:hypothetical protein
VFSDSAMHVPSLNQRSVNVQYGSVPVDADGAEQPLQRCVLLHVCKHGCLCVYVFMYVCISTWMYVCTVCVYVLHGPLRLHKLMHSSRRWVAAFYSIFFLSVSVFSFMLISGLHTATHEKASTSPEVCMCFVHCEY